MTSAAESLRAWQCVRLERDLTEPLPAMGPSDVTIVAYHFWPAERADAEFAFLECAIREAWRHCGLLPVSLVVDAPCRAVEEFAERHGALVHVHVSSLLRPGSVPSMSADCNANLARWFETEHCLVVQNDGFPIQSGLEAFLARFDYIGAPYVRRTWKTRLTGLWPRHAVGNGGFSLRTRRICEAASARWPRFTWIPEDNRFLREDAFFCLTLPLLSRRYRKSVSIAPLSEASRFSYDSLYGIPPEAPPFGFHGSEAFRLFRERGWIGDP